MSLAVGDWVILPEGVLAQVTRIEGDPAMAHASAIDGRTTERPLGNAELRWTRVPEDGLRVRLALDSDAMRSESARDPVALVVAALLDQGGEATTREIRDTVSAAFDDGDELRRWWGRAQKRLDDDPRIDARDARQKRYRLLADGQRQVDRVRSRKSSKLLHGLVLLDGPRLLAERDRSRRQSSLDEPAIVELLASAELDLDETVDPTDRFLSGEIAVHLGKRDDRGLGERLGPAVLGIDLLRLRGRQSRARALRLARDYLDARSEAEATLHDVVPIVASAAARSDTDAGVFEALVGSVGVDAWRPWAWAVRWGAPGTDENADPVYPDDLVRYRERLAGIVERWRIDGPDAAIGIIGACLDALEAVASTPSHGDEWGRTMDALGSAFWSGARDLQPQSVRACLASRSLTSATWLALIDGAPGEQALTVLRVPVERVYRTEPGRLEVMARLSQRLGRDLGATLLTIARDMVRETRAPAIALDALATAADPRSHAESVSLAGAIARDHAAVTQALESEAKAALSAAMTGDASRQGPLLLSEAGWQSVVRGVYELSQEAERQRDAATHAAAAAETRAAELEHALERREEALQQVRRSSAEERSVTSSRLSINLLKPVAAALADSYESGSVGALQDQLRAVLTRLRIRQVGAIGDVVAFDPDRHAWVSEGYPSPEVRIVAPGWEGQDGDTPLVLVPARVVGHEA